MAKKKRSGGIAIAIILLTIFIIIPAALVGTVFALFYVDDKTQVEVDEDFDKQAFVGNILSYALDDTREDSKISVKLPEKTINSLVGDLLNVIPAQAREFVPNAYIQVKEDSYHFVINGQAAFFKTSVIFDAKAEEIINEEDFLDSYLKFNITNYQIGRLQVNSLVQSLFDAFKLQDIVDQALSSTGFHMDVDLTQNQITYKYRDLLEDIKPFVNDAEGIYFGFIEEIFLNRLIGFSFYENNTIALSADVAQFRYVGSDETFDIYEDVKKEMELAYPVAQFTKEETPYVYDFFFFGYDELSDEGKAVIDSHNFAYKDGFVPHDYKGYSSILRDPSIKTIDQVVNEQMEEFRSKSLLELTPYIVGEDTLPICVIQDEIFTQYIMSLEGLIGTKVLMDRIVGEEYVGNFMCIDDFKVTIGENTMEFNIGIDLNGCELSIRFQSEMNKEATAGQKYVMRFDIIEVSIGSLVVKKELARNLLGMMQRATSSAGSFSVVAGEGDDPLIGYMTFDFSDFASAIEEKNLDGLEIIFELRDTGALTMRLHATA